jgi:hypothetical protein
MGRFIIFFMICLLAISQEHFLKHTPKESSFISYVNFKSLMNSKFYEKHGTDIHKRLNNEADEMYKEFLRKTGFDPSKDVHELFISGVIKSDNKSQFAIMIRGEFPEKKLLEFFNEKNRENGNKIEITETKITNRKAYIISEKNDKKDEKLAICYLDEQTIMAGSQEDLKSFLNTTETIHKNKELMSIIENLNYKKQVYTVVSIEQLNPKDEILNRVKTLVNYVTMSADIDDELEIIAQVQAKNEQNARDIESMMKGFIAASRLAVSEDRDLIDFMNEINIDRDEENIEIKIEINDERIEKLKKFQDRFEKKKSKI